MDHIVHRVMRFDRFALDLARGCLRAGDQTIDLRPKTFEVLCYLAENAGRLVPKQELFEAVWPDVSVCDDSLVQCIRELRHKLGDDERRLIKTVSRRGYLLDAAVSAQAPQSWGGSAPEQVPAPRKLATEPDVLHRVLWTLAAHKLRILGAAGGLVCIALIFLLGWFPVLVANLGRISATQSASAVPQPHPTFKDCANCPEMVAVPAGEFMMGSPKDERGRERVEGLPRRVVIPKPIAIGKFEATVDQFSAFVAETGMTEKNLCHVMVEIDGTRGVWGPPEASLREPGFEISGSQPVVCVSLHEAQAYVMWLRRRTGKPYRLLTEAEWEYAARAGTSTTYSFGDDETALCGYARFADLGSRLKAYPVDSGSATCCVLNDRIRP